MSRQHTDDEMRQEFIGYCRSIVSYYHGLRDKSEREKLEGIVFSILVAIDGEAITPAYELIPRAHPGDKQWYIERDENWYPKGHDIGGGLHEMWCKKADTSAERW